jgi:hypothetical protein
MSNVIKGDPNTTALEEDGNVAGPITLETDPNPFNPSMSVAFTVPVAGAGKVRVLLEVFNVGGRKVFTLVNGTLKPGLHRVSWNSRTINGQCASGVYVLKLSMEDKQLTRKIIMTK